MSVTQANINEILSDVGSAKATDAGPSTTPTPAEAARTKVLERVLGLEVTLSVILATRDMTIDAILDTTAGTIIEFDVPFDAELALNVGSRTIGLGQTVKVGENFGLRLTHLVGVSERANALGG